MVYPACGRQDGDGQQQPERSGGCVGDGVGAAEAGRGRLRGRRGADEQCGPACPAPAGLASASGPRGQCGCGQPGGDQCRGRPRMPGRGHDETAPGQVQGGRREQQHPGQAPNELGPFDSSCLLVVGSGGRDIPRRPAAHQEAVIASCSWNCLRMAASAWCNRDLAVPCGMPSSRAIAAMVPPR